MGWSVLPARSGTCPRFCRPRWRWPALRPVRIAAITSAPPAAAYMKGLSLACLSRKVPGGDQRGDNGVRGEEEGGKSKSKEYVGPEEPEHYRNTVPELVVYKGWVHVPLTGKFGRPLHHAAQLQTTKRAYCISLYFACEVLYCSIFHKFVLKHGGDFQDDVPNVHH